MAILAAQFYQADIDHWEKVRPTSEIGSAGFGKNLTRSDRVRLTLMPNYYHRPQPKTYKQTVGRGNQPIPGPSELLRYRPGPSQYPLGTDVNYTISQWGMHLRGHTPNESVNAAITEYRGLSADGAPIEPAPRNRDADALFLERLVRISLSGIASRRFKATPAISFSGGNVRRLKNIATGQHSVDIDDWAKAHAFSEGHDSKTLASLYQRGGTAFRIVLAADQLEVNGTWKEMADIVIQVDGRWYVPQAALSGL